MKALKFWGASVDPLEYQYVKTIALTLFQLTDSQEAEKQSQKKAVNAAIRCVRLFKEQEAV